MLGDVRKLKIKIMEEVKIKISLELNSDNAIRIANCLKINEPEIWEILKEDLKRAYSQTLVSASVCYCGKTSVEECEPCCSLACALKTKMYR